jgi:hypothetical protein
VGLEAHQLSVVDQPSLNNSRRATFLVKTRRLQLASVASPLNKNRLLAGNLPSKAHKTRFNLVKVKEALVKAHKYLAASLNNLRPLHSAKIKPKFRQAYLVSR